MWLELPERLEWPELPGDTVSESDGGLESGPLPVTSFRELPALSSLPCVPLERFWWGDPGCVGWIGCSGLLLAVPGTLVAGGGPPESPVSVEGGVLVAGGLVTVPFGCPPLPPPAPSPPSPPPPPAEPVREALEPLPAEVDASCPEAALTE